MSQIPCLDEGAPSHFALEEPRDEVPTSKVIETRFLEPLRQRESARRAAENEARVASRYGRSREWPRASAGAA